MVAATMTATLKVRKPGAVPGLRVVQRGGMCRVGRVVKVEATPSPYKDMEAAYWLYAQPGGWNLVSRVPCYVVKRTEKRATILAEKRDGTYVKRTVKPEKLIARGAAS